MADMMWAGRFSKKVDETVNAFNSSIAFDGRMYKQDIQGSIAHAAMLGDCGIISKEDSLAIIGGLKEIPSVSLSISGFLLLRGVLASRISTIPSTSGRLDCISRLVFAI